MAPPRIWPLVVIVVILVLVGGGFLLTFFEPRPPTQHFEVNVSHDRFAH